MGKQTVSLTMIRLGRRDRWIGTVFRHAEALDQWAMFVIAATAGAPTTAPPLPNVGANRVPLNTGSTLSWSRIFFPASSANRQRTPPDLAENIASPLTATTVPWCNVGWW